MTNKDPSREAFEAWIIQDRRNRNIALHSWTDEELKGVFLCDSKREWEAWQAALAMQMPAVEPMEIDYPHEQMDALAVARYKVIPSDQSMYWRHAVVAGDGQQHLYNGSEVDCQNLARKFAGAFLDGAFAFHQRYTAPRAQPSDALDAKTIAGALFDFLGYLATLLAQEAVTFSECHETSSAVVHLEKWAEKHSLSLDEADLFGWHTAKAVQKIEGQKRLPLTYEQKVVIMHENTIEDYNGVYYDLFGIMKGVEEAHGIK